MERSEKKEVSDDELEYHYIKNPSYRQIHIDGTHNELTPSGDVSCIFFAERWAIPKAARHKIIDGGISDDYTISADSIEGVVREIEFTGYFSIHTAITLKDELEKLIEEYNTTIKDIDPK